MGSDHLFFIDHSKQSTSWDHPENGQRYAFGQAQDGQGPTGAEYVVFAGIVRMVSLPSSPFPCSMFVVL